MCHTASVQSSAEAYGADKSFGTMLCGPRIVAVEPKQELEQDHPVGDWARIALQQTVWLSEPKAAMAWIRIAAYIQHWGSIPSQSLHEVGKVSRKYMDELVWPYIEHMLEIAPDCPSYYRLSGAAP